MRKKRPPPSWPQPNRHDHTALLEGRYASVDTRRCVMESVAKVSGRERCEREMMQQRSNVLDSLSTLLGLCKKGFRYTKKANTRNSLLTTAYMVQHERGAVRLFVEQLNQP